jgi:hypothetical protein
VVEPAASVLQQRVAHDVQRQRLPLEQDFGLVPQRLKFARVVE